MKLFETMNHKCLLKVSIKKTLLSTERHTTPLKLQYYFKFIKQPSLKEVAWHILLPFLLQALIRIPGIIYFPIQETCFVTIPVHVEDL